MYATSIGGWTSDGLKPCVISAGKPLVYVSYEEVDGAVHLAWDPVTFSPADEPTALDRASGSMVVGREAGFNMGFYVVLQAINFVRARGREAMKVPPEWSWASILPIYSK